MKPKEYLVSIGALPAGSENARGRLSLNNIRICEEAAGKGVSIDGYNVKTVAATPTAPATTRVTKVDPNTPNVIAELAPYRYNEDTHRAYELRDGKKFTRSLREACRNTGVSLVVCPCDSHQIVKTDGTGSVSIYVEGK